MDSELMKTAYIIKAPARNYNFDCYEKAGLLFMDSSVDISQIHNTLIDCNDCMLRIHIQQRETGDVIEFTDIWFLILSEKEFSNESLEEIWGHLKNFGNQLVQIIGLGLNFSYENIYAIPNVSSEWEINKMGLLFHDNSNIKGIFCLNDSNEQKSSLDSPESIAATGMNIIPEFGFSSDQKYGGLKKQFKRIHMSLPRNDVQVGNLQVAGNGNFDNISNFFTTEQHNPHRKMIFELYNSAISNANIFTSFLLLYKILEVIISAAEPTKLASEVVKKIIDGINKNNILDRKMVGRVENSLKNITSETSQALLIQGVETLINVEYAKGLNYTNFSTWRIFRGKITHPKKEQELTDIKFVKAYKTLREFVDTIILKL